MVALHTICPLTYTQMDEIWSDMKCIKCVYFAPLMGIVQHTMSNLSPGSELPVSVKGICHIQNVYYGILCEDNMFYAAFILS